MFNAVSVAGKRAKDIPFFSEFDTSPFSEGAAKHVSVM
jgi:hypothetical protein